MSAIGTWSKLPANWNKQSRYFVLADDLAPYGAHLPPALWSFCANMAPNGDLSKYTAERLARELEYRGPDPEAMKAKLVEAGYLTKSGQVVGWVGEMFMLENYREKARKAGRASAEKRRQAAASAGLSDSEDQRTEDQRRGDGDVEHDVQHEAPRAPLESGSLGLSPEQAAEAMNDFQMSRERVEKAVKAFNEKSACFPDDRSDFTAFMGWLRNRPEGKKFRGVYGRELAPMR